MSVVKIKWAALAEVRAAIKGWAFISETSLPDYIARAEAEVARLPEALRAEGDALVEPLREALADSVTRR